ncbi:hypothetical protein I7I53_11987 [Histoplasma capsulatum var. duboisii H88]|uniref:Uncharacterized protein n=1 Tax=Ajellomyces capsulatus (strain H88) TaxID=544711 RepID=A0A8A1LYV8_AJEC8|nr:hypothetical protein I7I53_11987 [Histoplasma capsulatum var. duboisii H88]
MESLHRPPAVNISNIDPRDPYTLFSLYISESDIQNIAHFINAYAEIQIARNPAINAFILHQLATTGSTTGSGTGSTTLSHVQFHQQLYHQLFEFSSSLPSTQSNPDLNHH